MSRRRRPVLAMTLAVGVVGLSACGRLSWPGMRPSGTAVEAAATGPASPAQPPGEDTPSVAPAGIVRCAGYIADEKSPAEVGLVRRALGRGSSMGLGDIVFLEMDRPEALAPGAQFSVIRPGGPVTHPTTGRRLGPMVQNVATVEVIAIESRLVRARIVQACGDVMVDDRLTVVRPMPALRRTAGEPAAPLEGTIVAAKDGRVSIGLSLIAYIDAGADLGIEPGDVFTVWKSTEALRLRGHSAFRPERETIPPTPIAELTVIRTSARTSTVLITQSAEDLSVGLRLSLNRKAGPAGRQ